MVEKSSATVDQSVHCWCCESPGIHSLVATLLVEENAREAVTFAVLGNMTFIIWLRGVLLKRILFSLVIQNTSLWRQV
jgi:hypothetical protein